MTSPTSARIKPTVRLATPFAARLRTRGFTLVELLVVIGIIVVLAGILTPATMKAYRQAQRTATANDLQAIGTALEAYKADFGDYPRLKTPVDPNKVGYDMAMVLCDALIGPTDDDDLDDDDGDENPITVATAERRDLGKRQRPGGKVYGPYLPADRFKMADPTKVGTLSTDPTNSALYCLLDRDEQPILYFPASPAKPNVRLAGGYIGAAGNGSRYNWAGNLGNPGSPYAADNIFGPFIRNAADTAANGQNRIRLMFRDNDMDGAADLPAAGVAAEEPVDLPFVLYSAGPDGIYGPEANDGGSAALDRADADKCDDVTNFR